MEETKSKCPRCRCWRNNEDFIKNNKVLKTCENCRENSKKSNEKNKCEHGRRRNECLECGGASICEHKRIRSSCIECDGSQVCEHKRIRSKCIECGGASICEHKRQRSFCIECGGNQICEHKRQRSSCIECDGSQICEHKRERNKCQICNFNLYLVNLQRQHIKRCFQYTCLKKTKSSIKYLGCDINTFIRHMEKKLMEGMTWDNIHIDHIKPVSRFNLDIEEEFNKCCHYTNLQPLTAKDNLNKHNKWTDENEVFWNENIIFKDYDRIYI